MVNGTTRAFVPIAVQICILVKGNRNTTRRMNGIALPKSTIRLRMKLMILFGNNPPGRVSLTMDPRGIAITQLSKRDIKDM